MDINALKLIYYASLSILISNFLIVVVITAYHKIRSMELSKLFKSREED